MDSPGANFKKTRRVQFKEVEPPHDKTRLGRSFSSSPYPKRHLESLDESTASSVADSPAKRPMKAFGQAWPIGSAGRSAGATPTRWSKSARQLLPIPEKVSPCKTAEYGQELQAKNGRSEVFARIKQKLDEQHDKLRREMESLLEESKKRMLDVVAEELAALDDVTAATVPVEGENHQ
uniref:Uncharacterized protein n=1 Tax=Globodera rostochiensis TaxID=31243 RepID=A0A914ICN5_GLORO